MKSKVLLVGIQKTGNTWIRFVIFNYFFLKNHNGTRTLTWDELQEPHLLRKEKGLNYEYNDGYPLIFHTHNSYDGFGINVQYHGCPVFFKSFDYIIYIYRNPFDTCISYWHFMENRNGVDYSRDLVEFTKWFLPKWIHHVNSTMYQANFILNYDILRKDSSSFYQMFKLITNDQYDKKLLEKAIRLSSFENIRKMSIEIKQPYGLAKRFRDYFCRDGRSGQYKEVMSEELINYIKEECKKEGINV